ncbi:MAG: DUF2723 domain-containing protein [Verrucomicrobiae bacterium]|nr:DUF2723 domain-containing protein [Verrucomicrobiae bacterium]
MFCYYNCAGFDNLCGHNCPGVSLEWSGLFSTAAMHGGVPFSGGYPVWTIYAWAFANLLPVGNFAWRVNLSSAVAAAAASGLIAITVSFGGGRLLDGSSGSRLLRPLHLKLIRGVCGYVAGAAFGLSGAVWGKAVVGEFWTLGALLFAGVLWLFTGWFFKPASRWRLYCAFFLAGMLLTNNQELLVALPALIAGVILADKKLGSGAALLVLPSAAVLTALHQWWLWIDFPGRPNWPVLAVFLGATGIGAFYAFKTRSASSEWKAGALCALALAFGLASHLYIPLASMTTPPVNWGYSRSVEGFLHTIGRGQFEAPNPAEEIGVLAQHLWWFLKLLSKDFGVIYLPFALLPIVLLRSVTPVGRRWLLALLAMFICVGVVMLAVVNPQPDTADIKLLRQYFTGANAVLACMCGVGLIQVALLVTRSKQDAIR